MGTAIGYTAAKNISPTSGRQHMTKLPGMRQLTIYLDAFSLSLETLLGVGKTANYSGDCHTMPGHSAFV